MFEWLTTTWLRFTVLLFSCVFWAVALSASMPLGSKAIFVLGAPIAGVVYYYLFLLLILVCEYLGSFGLVFSRLLIVYFYVFSRLVVQSPPIVSLPLTKL